MSSQAPPLARQIGRACAYGWIVGVGMTMAITVVRLAPGAVRFDLGEIALNAFNYGVVAPVLALPGLIGLWLTRAHQSR